MQAVFDECPYEGGYDLKIGCSTNRTFDPTTLGLEKHSNFKHALVMFGGLESIEGIVENDESTGMKASECGRLFDIYMDDKQKNLYEQGTRAIRTEEAILVVMGALYPIMKKLGLSK